MSEFITLEPPYLITTIIGVVVLVALLIKEAVRPNRKSLWLRMLFSLIAIASLLIIVIKPSFKQSASATPGILLTDGYNTEQLDSLQKALSSDRVGHYDSMRYTQKKSWFNQSGAIVIGDGIPQYDIPLWQSKNLKYEGSTKPIYGLLSVNFNDENYVGEVLVLTGNYCSRDSAKLVLNAFGVAIDSVLLQGGSQQFTLNVPLKAQGKFLLKLEEHVDNEYKTHTIPIIVREARLNNILILNAFPTFELKYLKNYLAEEGHKITVRNQITKGRYKFEFFNTNSSPIYRLNNQSLGDFDLIIISQQAVDQLSTTENDALSDVVKSGTGLLIMPGEGTFSKPSELHNFSFTPLNDPIQPLSLPDESISLDSYGYKIENDLLVTPLFNAMSATYRLESGKVGTTTLKSTYQLVLKGDHDAYKYLWSSIIKRLIFKGDDISVSSKGPHFVDEPMDLSIVGVDSISNLQINNVKIAPRQDLQIPSHWYARYWPDTVGWHEVYINSDTSWLYINQSGEFNAWKRNKNKITNLKAFGELSTSSQERTYWRSINLIWFYLLFLLSVGYLWLEPKLS